jgi:hypothetical protein
MKPARIALFLQLCLVAGIAAAATPEQEMAHSLAFSGNILSPSRLS